MKVSENRLIFIDFETTGLKPYNGDRIIEIGAVIIEKNKIIDEFETLINAKKRIPDYVSKIHGITNEMLINHPESKKALTTFRSFIGEDILVAHNIKFDISFLKYEFSRLGFSLNNKTFCTLEMSRKLFPSLPNHRLETVALHVLGVLPEGMRRHRALDDARLAAMIWMKVME